LEEQIEFERRPNPFRERKLEQLHEDTVRAFINQPGFGYARMGGISESDINSRLGNGPPPAQPNPQVAPAWSFVAGVEGPPPPNEDVIRASFLEMHDLGVADFVYPRGFGLIKDRSRVIGFQSHQFSQLPDPGERWSLQRLDLIGLVVHDDPVAYVSDSLPRMDELREGRKRPLDAFETNGLAALRKGEELYVRDTAVGLRVLGAVRSARQCIACHGGERGDLLGAFSYAFVKSKR
jgi:hypothetical protein